MRAMNHDRRTIIAALALAGAALPVIAQAQGTSRIDAEAILNDPDAPVGGNPRGDVTIVAFLDYNCPYCKASAPALARIVREDGKIRLVYKDWPVIAETSVYAAQLALAAAYQGRYQQAHDALMATKGRLSREQISAAIKSAGIDLDRLQADLDANRDKIAALLRRTDLEIIAVRRGGERLNPSGTAVDARAIEVVDFSNAGLRIDKVSGLAAGDRLKISFTPDISVEGTIVWLVWHKAGVQFTKPLKQDAPAYQYLMERAAFIEQAHVRAVSSLAQREAQKLHETDQT